MECHGENDVYVAGRSEKTILKVKERNGVNSNAQRLSGDLEAVRKGYAGIRLMEVTN